MAQPTPEQIKAAMRGNSLAFRVIVEAHQGFVYAVAYRFVNNAQDAEDITQDVFVRLWKSMGTYRQEVKLTTWLYKIVANRCLDFLKSGHGRQRKKMVDAEAQVGLETNSTPEKDLQQLEFSALIRQAAEELTPKQRAVFILRDLEGLDTEEVGVALDMSAGNVKSNLFHARQKVMEKLKKVYQTNDASLL